MAGHPIRKLLVLAAVGAVVAAVVRALRGEPAPQFSTHPTVTGGPAATPAPAPKLQAMESPDPSPGTALRADPSAPHHESGSAEEATAWAEPVDGGCPDGFPIKAKLSSKIYHQPGGAMYERTNPDRCYASAEAAEADGLRAAKR